MRIYFDNAATTPMTKEVVDAMLPFMYEFHGNPSSIHGDGRKVRTALEKARKTIANCLGASIGEIFFTSGGTESNNMALKCAVRDLGVKRIISSPVEHHCVSHTIESLARDNGIEVVNLHVDEMGCPKYAELEALLTDNDTPTLVSLMHANNEIGTLLNLQKVADLCEAHGAYLHSDTVQSVGHFDIDVNDTRISFLSAGAHKFHGPKGVGFIYINNDNIIKPFIDGGAQERNMRGGTENVIGIIGMARALESAYENLEGWKNHISALRQYMKDRLMENFDNLIFNGCQAHPLYTVLSVSFPPSPKGDMLLMLLDMAGISCSGGSACSSGAAQGSHVIAALNQPAGYNTVRFSFSHLNTKEEVDAVIEKLKAIIPARVTA